jgi:hypothetical protein
MSKPLFDNIPTFNFSELNGKTLKIYSGTDSGVTTTIGRDIETGKIYVLKCEGVKGQ